MIMRTWLLNMVFFTRLSSCDKLSFGPLLKFVSWRLIIQKVCLINDHCLLLYSSFLDSISHTQRKKNTTKAKNIKFVTENACENVYFTSFSSSHFFQFFFLTEMWFSWVCVCVIVKKWEKEVMRQTKKNFEKKRHAVDLRKPKCLLSAFNKNASKRHQSELISMKRLN